MDSTILLLMKQPALAIYWAEVFEKAGYQVQHPIESADWLQTIQDVTPPFLFIETEVADGQGFDLARMAKQAQPSLLCIVCMPNTAVYYAQAIQTDISGYLPDDIDDVAEVLHCLNQVRQGYRYISPVFMKLLGLPTMQQMEIVSRLTERQKQILRLVAKGHTARQIAAELGIAAPTVQNLKYQISHKAGLDGVFQLKIFAGSIASFL